MVISSILVISIVIDSDREYCYEHFKEKKSIYAENRVRDMYLNVCVCDEFLSSQKWQKMIKMVILHQSKSISIYLKIKISKICTVYYS